MNEKSKPIKMFKAILKHNERILAINEKILEELLIDDAILMIDKNNSTSLPRQEAFRILNRNI